jgi:hypothetical protein
MVCQSTKHSLPIRKSVPLEDIPHLHLGFLTGSVPGSVYVFFPNIYSIRIEADKYESNHLTDEELQLWFTAIFWPALQYTIPSSILQELPSTWAQVCANSRASRPSPRNPVIHTDPELLPRAAISPCHLGTYHSDSIKHASTPLFQVFISYNLRE